MKNFKIITVGLITVMVTNISASDVTAPEVKTTLPVIPAALPVTTPVIVPAISTVNPVAKIDEVKPVENLPTLPIQPSLTTTATPTISPIVPIVDSVTKIDEVKSVIPPIAVATPTIHPMDLLKTETAATPAAHENPTVAPVIAPMNALPAASPIVTAPVVTAPVVAHVEEVKPVTPAPITPTPAITAPVLAHVDEIKPVTPAPVITAPIVVNPIVTEPIVTHVEEVKPTQMAIPAAVDSKHVKIVKVYPVYDAVRLAVKNITNAAQDMINYVYNFMTKPAPTKKEETPMSKEEVKAESAVAKTEETKPVTPEIKA